VDWGFQVGDVCVVVEGDGPRGVRPDFEPRDPATVRLRAIPSDVSVRPEGRRVIYDGDGYGVFLDPARDTVSFTLKSTEHGTPEFVRIDLDPSGTRGELIYRRALTINPLIWKPLDELLVLEALRRGSGLLMHAAALSADGGGLLLIGVSGAGKTTISRALEKVGATILTDERAVVRATGRASEAVPSRPPDAWNPLRVPNTVTWVVDGTPWPGDGNYMARVTAPLRAVVFLDKSDRDELSSLSPARALAYAYRCNFAPFWSEAGTRTTLDTLERLVREVPCLRLRNRLGGDGPQLLLDWLARRDRRGT
jgi:hypothetical protein